MCSKLYVLRGTTMQQSEKKYVLGVHCSISNGIENAPIIGAKLGCRAIQIFTGSNQRWESKDISSDQAKSFLSNMQQGNIQIAFAHSTYLINLASPEKDLLKKSIIAMMGELKRADFLSLPFVVLHPGSHKETSIAAGINRIAKSINIIFDKTPDFKSKIALENTAGSGSSIGSRFEELAKIIELVENKDRVCVCFDTCHGFAAGYDIRDNKTYKTTWEEFDKIIGRKYLCAMHLNDSKGDLSSRLDRHVNIGEGKIGLKGFSNILNDPSLLTIPMVLETPKGKDAEANDKENLEKLRKLIKT